MKKHRRQAGPASPAAFSRAARRRHALALGDHRRDGRRCSASSLYGMRFVEQQFFPVLGPPELIVDFTLPQNTSIAETRAQMDRFEAGAGRRSRHRPLVVLCRPGRGRASCWPSTCSRRSPNFGQIDHRDQGARGPRPRPGASCRGSAHERVRRHRCLRQACWPSGRRRAGRCSTASAGRTSRRCASWRSAARQRSSASNPVLSDIGFDWIEPARVVKVDVLQDKARQLGVTSRGHRRRAQRHRRRRQHHSGARRDLSRQRRRPGAGRRAAIDRDAPEPAIAGQQRPVGAAGGHRDLPLRARAAGDLAPQPAADDHDLSAGIVDATRSRRPIVQQLEPRGAASFAATLPAGYAVAVAGPVEESAKSQGPIAAVVPLMLFVMATILMIQLQSFSAAVPGGGGGAARR